MIKTSQIALNRIISDDLDLEAFLKLTRDVGLGKVELRNDLPGKSIIDTLHPQRVRELASQYGIQIITINALQRFNLGSERLRLLKELRDLVEMASSIRCRAVVLCPNNDIGDSRDTDRIRKETLDNLKSFAPLFERAGLIGLVEPLGFTESSLGSLVAAVDIIRETDCSCYKVVHDTFHHHLGPESAESLQKGYNIGYTGLVHVSGVEAEMPKEQFRDEHRVLVGPKDRLKSREQVALLLELGYSGDVSFEPFSPQIQSLPAGRLARAIKDSLEYLCS
jgi:2-keto-myo-inositol isomerase